jgi:hypothetical protein
MKKGMIFLVGAFFLTTFTALATAEPLKFLDRIEMGGEPLTKTFSLKNYKDSEVVDRFVLTCGLTPTTFNVMPDASATLFLVKPWYGTKA